MKHFTTKIAVIASFFTLSFALINSAKAQSLTLPYTFTNNSEYADNEIYIGLVGRFPVMGEVWMNMLSSQLQPMSYSNNTLAGPSWSNTPDGKNKFAAMFYKLSDIPNKTINIPQGLFGCRIFISFKSPMFIYFHATGSYAGADLQNPNDANDGIRWELVELTWGDAGLWTNTSRVDAYQYPMGLEVTGFSGGMTGTYAQSYLAKINSGATPNINKKIGELLPHQSILDRWNANVDAQFYGCKVIKTHSMDGKAMIEQPSKIADFKQSGPYRDYFAAYIDDIWATYRSKDLYLNIGDRGTWRGKVTGDRFDFYDPADNSQATIYSKPTTTNAIEGAGALATTTATPGSAKYDEDLMIQAQVCAAINRHAIYTNTSDGVAQYNSDASRYFKTAPYNHYVNFFHNAEVSLQSQTYAFAYDDVGDHSSTIQCTFPTKVLVVIGGYASATGLTAVAGVDQTITDTDKNYSETVLLDATASSSKSGTIVSYIWKENAVQIATGNKANISFSLGTHTISLIVTDDKGNTASDEMIVSVLPNGKMAYKTHTIPGLIEAEDYDYGGANISYSDASLANEGGKYRTDAVDIEACTDTSGDYNVGYIEDGEWLEYSLTTVASGKYTINLRAASNNSTVTKQVNIFINNQNLGTISVNNTTGWQTWQTVSLPDVTISGSTNAVLRLQFVGGQFNINNITFTQQTSSQTINLSKGWNLIATNIQANNNSIETIFANLPVQEIKTMNTFWNKTQADQFNSLKTIDAGVAYLVNMNNAATLTIQGNPVQTQFIASPQQATWNLIAATSAETFSTFFDATNCSVIKNLDGFWIPNGTANTISGFETTKGYFIKK